MAFDKLGVIPVDPTTKVGQFRLAAGDSEYQQLSPPVEGFANFQLWTDDEIKALIAIAGGSVARAVSMAYAQIGAQYASSGAEIKTDDLTYSVKQAVGNWLALSKYWNDIANDADDRSAWDYFDLVDVGAASNDCERKPEGAPWPLSHFGFAPGGFRW